MSARVTVLAVRHGQSTWNASGRWQGRADPPLSELGQRQAQSAAARLGTDGRGVIDPAAPVVAVWTSHLQRAAATATVLADRLGVELVVDERFAERDAGPWTGLTRAEIEAQWPGWVESPRRPEGYEPDDAVVARGLAALDAVAASRRSPPGTVLVVSHGGLIRSLERHLALDSPPLPNLAGRPFHVDGVGAPSGLRASERVLLVDPDDTRVTVPGQI